MHKPPAELHRLISSAIKDADLAKVLRDQPEIAYELFNVPQWQQQLLETNPQAALGELRVHPNLQFKFLSQRGLLKLSKTSVQPYLDSLREDHHG
ncbi:hypothetical protein [Pseudomonas asiatica]|uniref:hypothetical protein n=1 Tax=Pseudomonas asiatica TaxID=2219225 RepID=UPI0018AB256C|nr:hypothetical protein [Pseudomonas asiatica]MBF8803521.1 hypothetical protein [Pseudomonas asiatica]